MASIYEQIGGEEAIHTAVEIFYRRVLSDDVLARFFDDVDMDRQMAKQASFLTMVTGGPNAYTGADMRKGHEHLLKMGLTDVHFDAVVEHLGETLLELGVDESLVQQVMDVARVSRDDVLGR